MEDIFHEEYGVSPALVADVHQFLYKSTGRSFFFFSILMAIAVSWSYLYSCFGLGMTDAYL